MSVGYYANIAVYERIGRCVKRADADRGRKPGKQLRKKPRLKRDKY
jgi:hypothetical protein